MISVKMRKIQRAEEVEHFANVPGQQLVALSHTYKGLVLGRGNNAELDVFCQASGKNVWKIGR